MDITGLSVYLLDNRLEDVLRMVSKMFYACSSSRTRSLFCSWVAMWHQLKINLFLSF